MVRRYTRPTGWRYQGKGVILVGAQSIANVTCDLSQQEHLLEVNELGSPALGIELT